MAVNKIINGFFSLAGCGFPCASVAHIATALRGAVLGADGASHLRFLSSAYKKSSLSHQKLLRLSRLEC
jgi:hypothetical protein